MLRGMELRVYVGKEIIGQKKIKGMEWIRNGRLIGHE